jgi:hypothetical protein
MPLESALPELWLAKGTESKRDRRQKAFRRSQWRPEQTGQALAQEANARVAMAELTRAQDGIAKGLSPTEGLEALLASWRVYATAFELYQNSRHRDLAERHLALSRETVTKLGNSLPKEEPLRRSHRSDGGLWIGRIADWCEASQAADQLRRRRLPVQLDASH